MDINEKILKLFENVKPDSFVEATENSDKEITENAKYFFEIMTLIMLEEKIDTNKIDVKKLRDIFAEILMTFSPRERDYLRLRFGMDDGRMRTLEEVAQLFGVTKKEVRATEAKALRKLRHPNMVNPLRQFLGMQLIKPLS